MALVGPARAKVRLSQGLDVAGAPVVVTHQREVFRVADPGSPAQRLGRLPRRSSTLVSCGEEGWAVTRGTQSVRRIRLFQVDEEGTDLRTIRPESSTLTGRIDIEGVAGADSRYVYLLPDGRYDRELDQVQPGHLEDDPDLLVIRAVRRDPFTWYVARDRAAEPGRARRLWLLLKRDGQTDGLRVGIGEESGPVDLQIEGRDLYLIHRAGKAMRFDGGSLRLVEDLSPMLRESTIRFFAADPLHYWIGTEPEDGQTEAPLWRIDRGNLDGGLFHAGAVPEGFIPVSSGRERIWFGALEEKSAEPVMAVDKSDGTVQSYAVRGRHARFWRAFGRGAGEAGEFVAYVGVVVVVGAVAILTFPIWIVVLAHYY